MIAKYLKIELDENQSKVKNGRNLLPFFLPKDGKLSFCVKQSVMLISFWSDNLSSNTVFWTEMSMQQDKKKWIYSERWQSVLSFCLVYKKIYPFSLCLSQNPYPDLCFAGQRRSIRKRNNTQKALHLQREIGQKLKSCKKNVEMIAVEMLLYLLKRNEPSWTIRCETWAKSRAFSFL